MKRFVSLVAVFIFLFGFVLPFNVRAQEVGEGDPVPELISETSDDIAASDSSEDGTSTDEDVGDPELISETEETGSETNDNTEIADTDSDVIDLDKDIEPVAIDEDSIEISVRQEDWNVFLFFVSGDVPDPDRVDYLWDFGDDIKSASSPIRHEYRRSGTYDVTLEIADLDGNVTVYSKELKISLFYLENPYLWVSLGLLLVFALIALLLAIRFDSSGGGLEEISAPSVSIGGGDEKPALTLSGGAADDLEELDGADSADESLSADTKPENVEMMDDMPEDEGSEALEDAPEALDMSRETMPADSGMLSYQGDEFAELDMLEKEAESKPEVEVAELPESEDAKESEGEDQDIEMPAKKPRKKTVKKKAAAKKKVVKKKTTKKKVTAKRKSTAKKKAAPKKKKSTAKKTSRKKK